MQPTDEVAVQAYKVAYLQKMAEAGILPSDMEKAAAGGAAATARGFKVTLPLLDRTTAALVGLSKDVGRLGLTGALVAPAGAAAAIGHLHAGPAKVSDADIRAERQLDLIRAYRNARNEFLRAEQLHREEGEDAGL